MEKSQRKTRESDDLARAARQLLDVVRSRVPGGDYGPSVGQFVDEDAPWTDPNPSTRQYVWNGGGPDSPHQMAEVVRPLLPVEARSHVSHSYLLEKVKDAAFDIGHHLLAHRDRDRALIEARARLDDLVAASVAAAAERRDVVLPLVSLHLRSRGDAVRIGPVLLARDGLRRFILEEGGEAKLGEFGAWAVEHFHLNEPAQRERWAGSLMDVGAYAKVEGVRGDRQHAIDRARQDVETALMVLRVSWYRLGSWTAREQYGTYGSFYDPSPRFGVMGTTAGGLRITLTAATGGDEAATRRDRDNGPLVPTLSTRHDPGAFADRLDRTDLVQPTEVDEAEIRRRWPVIEELAAAVWSRRSGWSELGIATRLLAEGLEATTAADAYLKFVTAVDVLFGRDEKGYPESQTTRLSERVAFLLGEDDPARRWKLFRSIQAVYGKRSAIVHDGLVPSDQEVYRVEAIARLTLLRLAWEIRHRRHANHDAFVDWVRRTKFGEPFEAIDVPRFLQLADDWFLDPGK